MSDPFIGQIYLVGYNFAQRSFALAQGQLLPISSNTALFSLYGTTYGGDGRTTFGLPDLRGRCALGMGNGPGLTDRRLGSRGGSETNTQIITQMANHTHVGTTTLHVSEEDGTSNEPAGNVPAASTTGLSYSPAAPDGEMAAAAATTANANTGGQQPQNNMQPYLTLNYEVALQGVFPSRS